MHPLECARAWLRGACAPWASFAGAFRSTRLAVRLLTWWADAAMKDIGRRAKSSLLIPRDVVNVRRPVFKYQVSGPATNMKR